MQACIFSTDMLVGPSALPHFMSDLSGCCTCLVQVMFTLNHGMTLTEKGGGGPEKGRRGRLILYRYLFGEANAVLAAILRITASSSAKRWLASDSALLRLLSWALRSISTCVTQSSLECPDMHTMQHCIQGRQHAHLAVIRLLQVHLCAQLANGVLLCSKLGLQLAGC